MYSAEAEELVPVWRERSPTHPSEGRGRVWKPGEGHVGKAFLDNRPILTGNANHPAVAPLCRAKDSMQEVYDNDVYISFASIPISIESNTTPFGILVATSNIENRFSSELVTELLKHFADTIAVIIELSEIDLSCITQDLQDTTNQ